MQGSPGMAPAVDESWWDVPSNMNLYESYIYIYIYICIYICIYIHIYMYIYSLWQSNMEMENPPILEDSSRIFGFLKLQDLPGSAQSRIVPDHPNPSDPNGDFIVIIGI